MRFAGNAHELAQRCGMKQSAFARLESGNANPTLETLKRVAEGLGKQCMLTPAAPERRGACALDGAPIPAHVNK